MHPPPSKSVVDRLGRKLKDGPITESDILLLDSYRRSFGKAYETVVAEIGQALDLAPTGRPAKSTSSVIEKLRRETIRLTQIQDIAGCRIVVPGILEQRKTVEALIAKFPEARILDRRGNPSHGYRAVHVVPVVNSKPVEIQVRTKLQHLWAELSEKFSDLFDPAIKYGGGPKDHQVILTSLSNLVARLEKLEEAIPQAGSTNSEKDLVREILALKEDLAVELNKTITNSRK